MMDNNTIKLPQAVEAVIFSNLDPVLNLQIGKKYGFSQELITKLAELLYNIFTKQTAIGDLPALAKKTFGLDERKTVELVKDIVGRRLLIFDSYFDGQATELMRKLGGQMRDYQQYIEQQRKLISEEAKELAESQAAETEKELPSENEPVVFTPSDLQTEKEDALKIFSSKITPFLESPESDLSEIIFDYNTVLIEVLDKEPAFKDKLVAALSDNKEAVTSKKIILKGRPVEPVVGNWLKVFIEKNGIEYFDNLKLSEFLNYSENCKQLSEVERGRLLNLFSLYRNLRFFPQTLADVPLENWQIIPFSAPSGDKNIGGDNQAVEELSELERRALDEE